jgi:hypothetical protein
MVYMIIIVLLQNIFRLRSHILTLIYKIEHGVDDFLYSC